MLPYDVERVLEIKAQLCVRIFGVQDQHFKDYDYFTSIT